MIIIGITGTIGAGKGTIVDYLVDKKNFTHYSVRAYLTKVIQQRGLKLNRDSMVFVANELRKQHNPAFIVEELYKEALESKQNAVIESIRTPGEIDLLKAKGNFFLLAIDAKPELRYERIYSRKSETDNITYKTFVENEKREMNSNDPTKQNLSACIKRADFVLTNNSSVEDLYAGLEDLIKKIVF